ncbi:hypothetical protein ACFX2K_037938 [Malus domestica]
MLHGQRMLLFSFYCILYLLFGNASVFLLAENASVRGGSTGPRNLERGEGVSRGGIGYASGLGYQDGVWVGLAVGHMGEGGDAL